MMPRTRRLTLALAVLWSGFGAAGRAEAGNALMTPAGLAPGDPFRFVFITKGTTTAISSNIATYNNFVNAQAGGATYAGSVVTWEAIGSTSSVGAINNVGQTATPVYLADGTLVTTSTTGTGLWSGSLLNPIDEGLSGGIIAHQGTWTGTNTNGSASANHLGDFFGVVIGNSTPTNGNWVNDGVWPSDTTTGVFHMFGISQVLVASVPEPSTLVMGGTAVCVAFGTIWSRRRRDPGR